MTEMKSTPFVLEKVKNEKSVGEQICAQRRSLSLRGFLILKSEKITDDSILALGTQKALKVLKLSSDTAIQSLENMPLQPNLMEIVANNTKLYSYKGLSRLKNVTVFSAKNTPLSQRPNFRLALLLAFGPRIRIINGEEITSKERMRAIKYASVCKSFVENDWDPTDEPPNEEETLKLIEKYQPKKARMIKNEKLKGRELEEELSPRKTLTLMNSIKKEEKNEYIPYDKYEFDDELADALIEKFKEIGIDIPKDENCQANLLKVIREFADITKNLCDMIQTSDSYQEDVEMASLILEE